MHQFFVRESDMTGDVVHITGEDARHIHQVLRMKSGEQVRISTHDGRNFFCHILQTNAEEVTVQIESEAPSTELNHKIYLFQAIPKGDRMETVIEKAVELGVYEIIPVEMKYCVVKWDAKKKQTRLKRYQAIAKSAAKQAKRSVVPTIHEIMTFQEATEYAMSQCEVRLVPYECKMGMDATWQVAKKITEGGNVSIMIGPEGGFSDEEIALVENQMDVISLGRRILRTDTAAISAMTFVMLLLENEGKAN